METPDFTVNVLKNKILKNKTFELFFNSNINYNAIDLIVDKVNSLIIKPTTYTTEDIWYVERLSRICMRDLINNNELIKIDDTWQRNPNHILVEDVLE